MRDGKVLHANVSTIVGHTNLPYTGVATATA